MTNHKAIHSIFTGLRPFTVGFDDMFDHFDNMSNHLPQMAANNYPPYNIVKTGSLTYNIEVALAGYGKKDISVDFEDNILKIQSVKSKEEKEVEDNDGVLHQGIAKRNFTKSFTIADDIEVKGAELKDGLLKVSLEKIVPDHKKARTINIK
jgi:molecular chaperone IbpA